MPSVRSRALLLNRAASTAVAARGAGPQAGGRSEVCRDTPWARVAANLCHYVCSGGHELDADALHRIAAEPVTELDPVGAGDAFVAGYLSTLLAGADTENCLRAAARVAAFCVAAEGDWEGLPATAELAPATAADISR